jgi:hypothetical protein
MTENIFMPIEAQKVIRLMQGQINTYQNQLQRFMDGVLIGMGIDTENNNVATNLNDFSVTISPIQNIEEVVAEIEKAGK